MSDAPYRPWQNTSPEPQLAGEGQDAWRQLLDESRHSISQMREVADQLNQRLQLGARLLNALRQLQDQPGVEDLHTAARLRMIEARLTRLEQSVDGLVAAQHQPRLAGAA